MLSADIVSPGFVAVIVILIVVLLILSSCIKIVPQATAMVVERLGGYLATWSVGVHFKIPFIDRVARKSNFKRTGCGFCSPAGDHKR